MPNFKVTFLPENKTVEVEPGKTVLEAAALAGIAVNSACAGQGVCGRCKVILKDGSIDPYPTGHISAEERLRGVILGCAVKVNRDLVIEVPEASRVDFSRQAVEAIEAGLKSAYAAAEDIEIAEPSTQGLYKLSSLAKKIFVKLLPPDLNDKTSDLERLKTEVQSVYAGVTSSSISAIRTLGPLLRRAGWNVTVSLGLRNDRTTEMLFIEQGNTIEKNYGIAFDIGTTTLSAQLVDLSTGAVIGTKAAYNKQATLGADVISRIIYADQEGGLNKLHQLVIDELNQMSYELVQEHRVQTAHVNYLVCAGNTTMTQLLLRVDPAYIRREPYVPTANFFPTVRAADEGFKLNQHALLSCVPGVSSYVGGDITAGVLSSGLDRQEKLSLLIDIGTNGEIVLGNKEFMISCAASAGPAFEGSGVTCGMRASGGAIQKVAVAPGSLEVTFQTIGGEKPRGICGSGYIDLLRSMLEQGVIDKNGKISEIKHERIRQTDSGKEFIVAFKRQSAVDADIVITESDIENLKRAKAAIYSACATLVRHVGLDLNAVQRIFIAGGFGTYLDIESAIAIGLLPDLERRKFLFIGNSSLAGARQVLLSEEAFAAVNEIARKMTYFELSVEPAYMDEYMAALFFPHTDLLKFPTVAY